MKKLLLFSSLAILLVNGYGQTAEEFVQRGRLKSYDGLREAAIEEFSKAIAVDPQYAPAYFYRGIEEKLIHDYTASITDLTKAITLQPNDEQAYLFRGITLIALEKYEEAEKDFSRSLQINPTADAYRFRANVRNSLSNPFGAMEDCDSALAFKPNYMEAYCARGEANASIRNYDGAIADLTAALAIEPGNALSLFYRGYANFERQISLMLLRILASC